MSRADPFDYGKPWATLCHPGRWPASSEVGNAWTVLDVDVYRGCASVLGLSNLVVGEPPHLQTTVFSQEDGEWVFRGAGGGWNEVTRTDVLPEVLRLDRQNGIVKDGKRLANTTAILCSPEVAEVVIKRREGTRHANVGTGPGWLTIIASDDDQPEVSAHAADGQLLATVDPVRLTMSRTSYRRTWRPT